MTTKDDVESTAVGESNIENAQNHVEEPEMRGVPDDAVQGLSTTREDHTEPATESPLLEANQAQPEKEQQQEKAVPKTKKGVNPDFKELQETGSWGKLSRSEFHVVMGVVAMVVVAVVVLVVLVLTHVIGHKENASAPTLSPVAVFNNRVELLKTVRNALGASNVTDSSLQDLPTSVVYYQDKLGGSAGYEAQAMSWLLYDDEHNHDDEYVDGVRYALAAAYFAWNGSHWVNGTNWLTSTDYCDWHGVTCDIKGNVTSLDLFANNLAGTIPPELALVKSLVALNVPNNHLVGTLPAGTILAIPGLDIINVANNSLSGTIPDNLRRGENDQGTSICLFSRCLFCFCHSPLAFLFINSDDIEFIFKQFHRGFSVLFLLPREILSDIE